MLVDVVRASVLFFCKLSQSVVTTYGAFFAGCEECWQVKADTGHRMKMLNSKSIQNKITILGIMTTLFLYADEWITIKLLNQERLIQHQNSSCK